MILIIQSTLLKSIFLTKNRATKSLSCLKPLSVNSQLSLKLIFTITRSATSGKDSIAVDYRKRFFNRLISEKCLNSKKAFDGLLQLLTLNLSKNAIQTIPTDAFFGLVSLRKMDLSRNFMEKLDNKTNSIFEDCLSLQEVNDEDVITYPTY